MDVDGTTGGIRSVEKMVTKQPVLKFFDPKQEVTIQCDTSDYGLGATLLQEAQPVAFASCTLTEAERNYAQIEKECLAIVFGCERFEHYIYGHPDITIETDHKPLEIMHKKPLLSAPKRLQKMLLHLQKFDLTIKYKRGSEVIIADMLSRAPMGTGSLD